MNRKLTTYTGCMYASKFFVSSGKETIFEFMCKEICHTKLKDLYLIKNNLIRNGFFTEGCRYES
jgi:hypothetical protein